MKQEVKTEVSYQLFAGTSRGGFAFTECDSSKKVTYNLDHLNGEITAMEWGRSCNEILLGNKNGAVWIYNIGLSCYSHDLSEKLFQGSGSVVGLGIYDDKLVIGKKSGGISFYDLANKKLVDKMQVNLNESSTLNTLVLSANSENIFATGGDDNDLKLWDVNTKKDVFKAKSLGKDHLELPIPTSVRGIAFMNSDNLVSCATREGMVLLYDIRAQRRPVKKYQESKACFTCIAPYNDRCLVGTAKGYLQLIDINNEKCLKTFQPSAGAITSIQTDSNYVVTSSLDKHIRIQNIDTKEVVFRQYLKIGLTRVLLKPKIKVETTEPEGDSQEENNDEEYDNLFDKMENVGDVNDDSGQEEIAESDEEGDVERPSTTSTKRTKSGKVGKSKIPKRLKKK